MSKKNLTCHSMEKSVLVAVLVTFAIVRAAPLKRPDLEQKTYPAHLIGIFSLASESVVNVPSFNHLSSSETLTEGRKSRRKKRISEPVMDDVDKLSDPRAALIDNHVDSLENVDDALDNSDASLYTDTIDGENNRDKPVSKYITSFLSVILDIFNSDIKNMSDEVSKDSYRHQRRHTEQKHHKSRPKRSASSVLRAMLTNLKSKGQIKR